MSRAKLQAVALAAAALLLSCDTSETGMGVTESQDFTLTVEIPDKYIHVGDEAPITVRVRRTDGSNLQRGSVGVLVVSTSVHGDVDQNSVSIAVDDYTTAEVIRTLVYTAESPGIAEVRISFMDATALVEILISRVNT